MTTTTRGRRMEARVARWLQRHGLRLLAHNHRCRDGEIDLIMTHGEWVVFVEVRYRARADYGGAAATVDARKQRRIARCAAAWLQRRRRLSRRPARFDVVAVDGDARDPQVTWIRDAFRP